MTSQHQVIADLVDAAIADPGVDCTLALLVLLDEEVVAERYGTNPDGSPVTASSTLISWSMAKSVTHALFGLLVADGLVDVDSPAPIATWRNDERKLITIQHLLNMRSGLRFVEDYVDAEISHCIEMLFGEGAGDVAAYAAALPLDFEPGTHWSYASGTTNILCRIAADIIGNADDMRAYLFDRLFAPLGMTAATPKFDDAGTFIGSSFLYATAREFAAFGELYRNDGVVGGIGGSRILPVGWVDHARRAVPVPETENHGYGAHWWLWPEYNAFAAHGYEGQRILVVPDRKLTIVRLGKTPIEQNPTMEAHLGRIVEAVPFSG